MKGYFGRGKYFYNFHTFFQPQKAAESESNSKAIFFFGSTVPL